VDWKDKSCVGQIVEARVMDLIYMGIGCGEKGSNILEPRGIHRVF